MEEKNLIPGPEGTLLFAMYASVGKLTVTAMSSVWNQAILGLVPNEQVLSVEFLAYWLELIRPHLGLLARSNTQDNLSAEVVRELPVPDISRAEQERIVGILNGVLARLSAAQDTLRRQLDLLTEHRQALVTAAVAGEIDIAGELA